MIITLKGADFSKNNIGPLSSWLVSREIGDGARYSGPAYVVKGLSYNASVVIGAGYRLGAEGVKVYMGDVELENVVTFSEDRKTLTISIPQATGNIFVKVATESTAVYYTITYRYVDLEGNLLKEEETEKVLEGTERYFATENAPRFEDYIINAVNPTNIVVENDVVVTYTYAVNTPYWISEKLYGGSVGSGAGTSMLNTQYFFIDDANYVAELSGKSIQSIAITRANKSVTGAELILCLVPLDNTLPTAWEEKVSIPFSSDEISTIVTLDLETPLIIPSGYTLGYRSTKGNVFGGGTINSGYNRSDKYYSNNSATTFSPITMAPIDCKVKYV